MKKLIATLLATLVLLMAFGALANETMVSKHYDFGVATPEGYIEIEDHQDYATLVTYTPEDETKAHYTMSIAYSELFDGSSLTDLEEDDLALMKAMLGASFNVPTVEDAKTASETPLIVINETDSASDYVSISTLFKGYMFEMKIEYLNDAEVTDADIEQGIKIYSDITFFE